MDRLPRIFPHASKQCDRQDKYHALSAGQLILIRHLDCQRDIGWAIERHATLDAREYDWNEDFEALVATLFAEFASQYDPVAERCWIAEVNGERAECAGFSTCKSPGTVLPECPLMRRSGWVAYRKESCQ